MAGAWVLPVLLPSLALLPCLGSPGSWALLPLWGRGGTRVTGVFQGCCLHKCCCWEEGSLELWVQLWLEGPASWVHHRCCPAPCGCGALCPTCHLCCCFQFYSSFGLSCCGCGGARIPALPLSLVLPPPPGVFLPEGSHGQRSRVGYGPWSHRVGHSWVTNTASSMCPNPLTFGYKDVWISPASWWDEHRKLCRGMDVLLKQEKQRELFTIPWWWCLPSKPCMCVCGCVGICPAFSGYSHNNSDDLLNVLTQ